MAPGIVVDDLVAVRGPVWNGTYGALVGKVTAAVVDTGTSYLCAVTVDAPSGLVGLTNVRWDVGVAELASIQQQCLQYVHDTNDDAITEARQISGADALAGIGGGG